MVVCRSRRRRACRRRLAHPDLQYVHVRAIPRDVLVRNVVRLPHQLQPASRSTDLSPAASYRELARAPPPKLCLPVPVPGRRRKRASYSPF
jgi:hypothetical protein